MSSLITQLKFYFSECHEDGAVMRPWLALTLWKCHCSLNDEETWDNIRYDIGLNWAGNPMEVEATPKQDLAFKELLKRAKAWEDKNQATFRGTLYSECGDYSITC